MNHTNGCLSGTGARLAGSLFALAVVAGVPGCTDRDAPRNGPTGERTAVRDSAGVRIVENVDPGAAPKWTLAAEPTLTIGDDLGADGFGRVAGVVRLDNGVIVVADALALTVRRFDPTGAELTAAGRQGSGPGEFETIDRMWSIDGARVGVWDGRLSRYTIIDGEGEPGPSVSLQPTAAKGRYAPIGFLSDGRLLAKSDARDLLSLEYYRPDLTLLTFDSEGAVADTIATVPGVEMWDWVWELGTTPLEIPFGRATSFRLAGGAIYVAANEGYQLDRYDTAGALTLRIRADRVPREVTNTDIASYRAAARERDESSEFSKGPVGFWAGAAEAAPYPEHFPYYDRFEIDDQSRAWVRDYPDGSGQTTYLVFERDGRLLASAEFPARFTVSEIRGSEVLGVWRDELDLEHIRLYPLVERPDERPDERSGETER